MHQQAERRSIRKTARDDIQVVPARDCNFKIKQSSSGCIALVNTAVYMDKNTIFGVTYPVIPLKHNLWFPSVDLDFACALTRPL